jgi:hypothetical protein
MRRKHESYEEGNRITDDAYMQLAEDKYKSLIETNEWNVPSKKDEEIVALQATVAKLQKDVAGNRNKKSKKNPEDKSDDNKKKSKGQKNKEREAWKKVPPKEGDKKTIKKGEKTYHWCPNHKAWTIHKPSDCKGVALKKDDTNKKEDDKDSQNKNKKELKISKALQAIAEGSESDDEE